MNKLNFSLKRLVLSGKLFAVFALITVALAFYSCMEDEVLDLTKTDFETFNIPVNVAMPVAKGNILLKEIIKKVDLEDFELKTFEDGLIYFEFFNKINVGRIVDVEVPNQKVSEKLINDGTVYPPFITIQPNDSFTFEKDFNFSIKVEGAEIDKAVFESGKLKVFAPNVISGPGSEVLNQSLNVKIIDLSFDNRVFEQTVDNNQFGSEQIYSVDEHILVASGAAGNEYIRATYAYTIKNSSNNVVTIPTPATLTFDFSMQDINPRYVTGYFGNRVLFQGNSIVELSIINTSYLEDSTIFFKDPQIDITLYNPVVMPFDVNVMQLRLINTEKTDTLDLDFDTDKFEVDGGTPTFIDGNRQVEITPFVKEYAFDKDNSNIDKVFGRVFDEVCLHYNVVSNPNGKDPLKNNVIRFDSSEIYIDSHAILPLWIKAMNFTYEDTVAFDFEAEVIDGQDLDTVSIEKLDSVTVILGIKNTIPIELKGQVYMADAGYNIIDSVFINTDGVILKGAIVNAQGESTGPGETVIELMVSPDKLDLWRDCKFIMFNAEAYTSQKEFVKVYDSIGIEFYVGFVISGNVDNALLESGNN
jgi:hypothetical protein